MKITSAEFVKSAFEEAHWTRDNLPEIAFLGRSNVGKSSLINSLLNRKALARTSNTPGRTQSLNFFLINRQFYFVDLPGYGYAKVPKAIRADWGAMAQDYLAKRGQLRFMIQLVDARHLPSEQDRQLHEWLQHHEKPHAIAATKADKLSSKELLESLERINQSLPGSAVVPYSSVTRQGRHELWQLIQSSFEIN